MQDKPTHVAEVYETIIDNSQPEESIEAVIDQEQDQPADEQTQPPAHTWQASEYIHHDKGRNWYIAVIAIGLVLSAILVVFQQWYSIPVVVFMAAAVVVYGARPPRTMTYMLDEHGITIENRLYQYTQFHSFSVLQDADWHTIDLEPTQRLMPRLTVLFGNDDFPTIVSLLGAHLPEIDRRPDMIERLSRYLKF